MELVKFGKLKEQSYTMKESLRALKTNIQFCGDDIRTLLVTSSVPNEGKSTVALDLARSLTESGNRVLFIDTDMRKSVLAGRLRATAASGGEICGLSHYLSGQRRLEEVMYGTEIPGLFMIFAGPSVPNPTEILEKKYFQELLNFGKEHFNYIIIDCAPIGAAIDAAGGAKRHEALGRCRGCWQDCRDGISADSWFGVGKCRRKCSQGIEKFGQSRNDAL